MIDYSKIYILSYDDKYQFNFKNAVNIIKLYTSIVNLSNKYSNRKLLKYKDNLIVKYLKFEEFEKLFLDNVTTKFNEFIKGIFYFSNNIGVAIPV